MTQSSKKIVIAIDGFSSCGKSTMAKALAKSLKYIYIDSGAMYRAVTLYCIRQNLINDGVINTSALQQQMENIAITFKINENTQLPETYLNGENVEQEIRSMRVSNLVSPVSTLAFVRTAMVAQQQKLGEAKGIVMDGRDIGTTVFPNAELKIFVTASAETRAQRRVDEIISKGGSVSFQEVLENVQQRDHIDQTRKESPLRKADDALLLDNSHLTIEQQNQWIKDQFERVISLK